MLEAQAFPAQYRSRGKVATNFALWRTVLLATPHARRVEQNSRERRCAPTVKWTPDLGPAVKV